MQPYSDDKKWCRQCHNWYPNAHQEDAKLKPAEERYENINQHLGVVFEHETVVLFNKRPDAEMEFLNGRSLHSCGKL